MASLGEKRLFLLDMDGTIYLDEDLFPGTLPFLEAVRAAGGRYLFLTNNSSRTCAGGRGTGSATPSGRRASGTSFVRRASR